MHRRFSSSPWLGYGFAVIAVALATVLRWALHGVFGESVAFITFYPAVALVALIAGGRAGAVATILSALAADAWVIPPYGLFSIGGAGDALALALFIAAGMLISAMAAKLGRAREREAAAAERLKGEETLRQHRERLRVTLHSIGDAVLATDTDGKITLLNPVAVELTGWPEEQALGQPILSVFRIINEKTRRPAEDIVARVLRENSVVALANHTALLSRDGREIPIEDSAAPIRDSAGRATGVVLVFHDVTQKGRVPLNVEN